MLELPKWKQRWQEDHSLPLGVDVLLQRTLVVKLTSLLFPLPISFECSPSDLASLFEPHGRISDGR